jgi:hypothetical protein
MNCSAPPELHKAANKLLVDQSQQGTNSPVPVPQRHYHRHPELATLDDDKGSYIMNYTNFIQTNQNKIEDFY